LPHCTRIDAVRAAIVVESRAKARSAFARANVA
jgi:hypothetical protein